MATAIGPASTHLLTERPAWKELQNHTNSAV